MIETRPRRFAFFAFCPRAIFLWAHLADFLFAHRRSGVSFATGLLPRGGPKGVTPSQREKGGLRAAFWLELVNSPLAADNPTFVRTIRPSCRRTVRRVRHRRDDNEGCRRRFLVWSIHAPLLDVT